MKNNMTVLIADDNFEFSNLLNQYLNKEQDIKVVGVARDGIQTIEMITNFMPDIVLLDLIMPNIDGIGVLEKVFTMELSNKPSFVILSAIGQDVFIQKAIALGVEYYIVKPFDVDVLIMRIRQVYKERDFSSFSKGFTLTNSQAVATNTKENAQNLLEVQVTNLIREIGVPPNLQGYRFVREAVLLSINNPKGFNSITKVLYPAIAKKFNSSPQKVERAIRSAIENAWTRGDPNKIDELLGKNINPSNKKPTNSEFIAMISDKIQVKLGFE